MVFVVHIQMSWNFLERYTGGSYGNDRRRGRRGYPFEFLNDRLSLLLQPWQAVSFTCGAFVGCVFLVSPDLTSVGRTFIISSFHGCPLLAPAAWGHRCGIWSLFSQLLKVCLCWCWDLPSFLFCCLYLLVISWLTTLAALHCLCSVPVPTESVFITPSWLPLAALGLIWSLGFSLPTCSIENGVYFCFPSSLWMFVGSQVG